MESLESPNATAVIEPSAPPAPEAPSAGFHEMNKGERDEFLRSGKPPAREKKDSDGAAGADADSSAAPADGKKAAEIAAKDGKAASEPAAPAKEKKARNAEENRVNELLEDRKRERDRADRAERERADLMDRLKALESKAKPDAKTDSSTTPDPSAKLKEISSAKDFPKIEDFDSPNDWAAAVHLFTQNTIEAANQARETQTQEQVQQREYIESVVSVAAERLQADEKAHPELIAKVDPVLRDIVPTRLLPPGEKSLVQHFIKDQITFEADHPLQLHAFYSTPEGKAELKAMTQMDRRGVERTIARRDLSFAQASSQGQPAVAEKKAAPKTFTKAPPPPDKEGPKGATPADQAESAVNAGDFDAFKAEMDARDPATAQRWGRRR